MSGDRTMRVGAFHYPPFTIESEDLKKHSGIEVLIVKTVAQHLGILPIFVRPSDGGQWGQVMANGSANGLRRDVLEARVDVGIAQLFLTDRMTVFMDSAYPYDIDGYCYTARNPSPRAKLWAVAGPYGPLVWTLILLGLITGAVVYSFASKQGLDQSTINIFRVFLKQNMRWQMDTNR